MKKAVFSEKEKSIIKEVDLHYFDYLFRVYDLVYVAIFPLYHYVTDYGYDLGGESSKILTQVGSMEGMFEDMTENATYLIADILREERKEPWDALSL